MRFAVRFMKLDWFTRGVISGTLGALITYNMELESSLWIAVATIAGIASGWLAKK